MQIRHINFVNWNYILKYFKTSESIFRIYQNYILELIGKEFTGDVIELGGEKKYNHKVFFPNASSFLVTNIGRDCDQIIDVTRMPYEDNSADNFISISVLQHVPNILAALEQIKSKLKPGGRLLIINAFAHPICDEKDYWRIGKDVYLEWFADFHIETVFQIGGKFSVAANTFQRPKGKMKGVYLLYKLIGFFSLLLSKILERPDSFPLGFGIYAIKK